MRTYYNSKNCWSSLGEPDATSVRARIEPTWIIVPSTGLFVTYSFNSFLQAVASSSLTMSRITRHPFRRISATCCSLKLGKSENLTSGIAYELPSLSDAIAVWWNCDATCEPWVAISAVTLTSSARRSAHEAVIRSWKLGMVLAISRLMSANRGGHGPTTGAGRDMVGSGKKTG